MTDPRGTPSPLRPEQQRLVLDEQGFARRATRFYARKTRGLLAEEDVGQLVQLALTEAARSFDAERGVAFASFAWSRVAGRIAEAARGESAARDPLRRAAAACLDLQDGEVDIDASREAIAANADALAARIAAAAVMSVAAVAPAGVDASSPRAGDAVALAAPQETGPEADVLAAELRAVLANAVAALPERPQRLIDLYYREGHALRDVAATLGVSYATARRDHDTALDTLRESCATAGYDRG